MIKLPDGREIEFVTAMEKMIYADSDLIYWVTETYLKRRRKNPDDPTLKQRLYDEFCKRYKSKHKKPFILDP